MNEEWGMHPENGLYVALFVLMALLILFPLSESYTNFLNWLPFKNKISHPENTKWKINY